MQVNQTVQLNQKGKDFLNNLTNEVKGTQYKGVTLFKSFCFEGQTTVFMKITNDAVMLTNRYIIPIDFLEIIEK